MADPNLASEHIPDWAVLTGGLSFVCTAAIAGWKFVSGLLHGKKEEDSARHVVLESASLADMGPVRDLARGLAEIYPVVGMSEEMLVIMRRLERDADVAKEVAATLRDQRMVAGQQARDRDNR